MAEIPRLNAMIGALEQGKPTFVTFTSAGIDNAVALSTSKYDGIVFEMEHNPWDAPTLRDSLQYMLNRAQILKTGTPAPGVTPMVRIPPNGSEMNQWVAKQVLDSGVFGIVWPHVSTIEEAYKLGRVQIRLQGLPEHLTPVLIRRGDLPPLWLTP